MTFSGAICKLFVFLIFIYNLTVAYLYYSIIINYSTALVNRLSEEIFSGAWLKLKSTAFV